MSHGETPVGLSFLPGRKQFHVAFSGPSWSGGASVSGLSHTAEIEASVLHDTGALHESTPPALFFSGESVVAAHATARGVEVMRLGASSGALVFADAQTFAVSAGRRQSRLFGTDARGLLAADYDTKRVSEDRRWLEHAGKRPLLAAARAGGADIAFAAWEGERALFVALELDGKPKVVRHELPSECVGIGAFGAGNRAGIAVALAGTDAIEVGIVDVRGVLVERLHTCLMGRGARWRHPQVLWIEDGFCVLAVDETEERTVVARFADGEIFADLTGAAGPFSAAYYERSLYLARASLDETTDRVTVRGHRIGTGTKAATFPFELPIEPPRALWRARAAVHAGRVIRATCTELDTARHGYRGVASSVDARGAATVDEADPQRLRIEPLHAELGAAELAVRPCERAHDDGDAGTGYDVTLLSLATGALGEPEPEGSFEKLARWVRERVSRKAFERALAERAWIDRAAEALDGHGFWDRDENGLRLIVHVRRPPDPEQLAGWVKRLLSELAARVWEKPDRAPPSA